MKVLVTRPAEQAQAWLERLRATGFEAEALPLLAIEPAQDGAAVQASWQALSSQRMVMFVSPNAAQHFFALRPGAASSMSVEAWPAGVLAAAPGPGTVDALTAFGVPSQAIVSPAAGASQFDSESLWAELVGRDWQGAGVLIVRGEGGGRDWLATRLREAGADVRFVAAYRRAGPSWSAAQQETFEQALAQPSQHLWWFSSSEAIDHLVARAPPGTDWSAAAALATHSPHRRAGAGAWHRSS